MTSLTYLPDETMLTGKCYFISKENPDFYQDNLDLITQYMTLVSDHLNPRVNRDGVIFKPSIPIEIQGHLWHKTIKEYFESSSVQDAPSRDLPKTYTSHLLINKMRENNANAVLIYAITNYSGGELISQMLTLKPATKHSYFVLDRYKTNKHLYSEYDILKYHDFDPEIGLVTRKSRLTTQTATIINNQIAHKLHLFLRRDEDITDLKDQYILRDLLDYFNHNVHYKGAILKRGHFDTLANLKHWYYTELYKPLNKYIENTNNYHAKAWQTQKGGTKYAFKAYSYADLTNTFNINKQRQEQKL